MHIKASAKL